ncbi:type III-B CRISPR module-associated protein Cmr5 [Saccharopolyspora sp. K220]|uniref:type III-B CRISPR module-associated protein Cmr5 n=1 Tax=Saccharopolyspora soli TaxID=2926618 RepID=UPI001F597E85|nr:type III-B CRISPR module-associated protein Cmr5 [Saccharopolyspora soli]MCI2423630.1 type III-B CRISPR module-associated protein Cmr5 [Saccharopolyspora soli]
MAQRIDQELAVAATKALPEQVDRELLTVLRAVPVQIHNNGLAMAATYLLSKAKGAREDDRYWTVAHVLLREAADVIRLNVESDDPLVILDRLIKAPNEKYVVAQRRAQELAAWLGRIGSARKAPGDD